MPIYVCRAVDGAGRTVRVRREAASEAVLLRELGREGLAPVELVAEEARSRLGRGRRRFGRSAVQEFAATMALLLSSGLTLRDALEIAQTIFPKGDVNLIVVHLLESVRRGSSVDEALEELGGAFPAIFRAFVRVGEKAGSLEGTMKQVADYLSEDRKIRDRVVSSLTYPILVLVVAIAGVAGIVLFVLPGVREVFGQLGSELPPRIEAASRLFRTGAVVFAVTAGAALLGALAAALLRRSDERFAERLDLLLLELPAFGRIRYLREMTSMLFALEGLTASGFGVEDALTEVSRLVQNRAFRSGLQRAREAIDKGGSLSAAFLSSPVFRDRVGRWVAIGERSGRVEQAFGQLRRYYQAETEKWTGRFMSLVEPVLILIVGVVILALVVLFVTPIFTLYEGLL